MNTKHPTALFTTILLVALAGFAWQMARAQPIVELQRAANQNAQGGTSLRAVANVNGSRLDASARQRLVSDGQGNVKAAGARSFATAAGGQGTTSARLRRQADGSVDASRQGSVTTADGGSAQRETTYTRNADGQGSAERSTSATNARTGVTYEGSATWTRGQGRSRSGTCTDAAGNAVTCGSAR
jgi:hypothetical protein